MIGTSCVLVEQRLEHLIFVGIDGALHDVLAKAPGGVDQHDLVEAGLGVDREHHAGAAEIGAHHVLHADRQRDLHVVEALGLAVADGAVGEQRGVAAPAGIEQRGLAADVEKGLLLAGKAGVGQVFGRGAGAHRDVDIGFRRRAGRVRDRPLDRLGDVVRPVALQDRAADRLAGLGERATCRRRDRLSTRGDRLAQAVASMKRQ